MSHICNTKVNVHVYKVAVKSIYLSLQTCLEALSDSILTVHKRNTHENVLERQYIEGVRCEATRVQ